MLRAKLPLFCLLALALSLFPHACIARGKHKHCAPSFCGNVTINYPLRLKSQPPSCGYKDYELVCENNRTIMHKEFFGNFSVKDISYDNQTIRLLDVNLDNDNCSIPRSSLYRNALHSDKRYNFYLFTSEASTMYVVNCKMKMNPSVYIAASRCTNRSHSNYVYFLDGSTPLSHFDQSCKVEAQVPIMVSDIRGLSTFDIYRKLLMGVQLEWSYPYHDNV